MQKIQYGATLRSKEMKLVNLSCKKFKNFSEGNSTTLWLYREITSMVISIKSSLRRRLHRAVFTLFLSHKYLTTFSITTKMSSMSKCSVFSCCRRKGREESCFSEYADECGMSVTYTRTLIATLCSKFMFLWSSEDQRQLMAIVPSPWRELCP